VPTTLVRTCAVIDHKGGTLNLFPVFKAALVVPQLTHSCDERYSRSSHQVRSYRETNVTVTFQLSQYPAIGDQYMKRDIAIEIAEKPAVLNHLPEDRFPAARAQ
jgi:hypothetical protein